MTEMGIRPDLYQAYLETDYRVLGDEPFTLRIDHVSFDLLTTHKRLGVECSTFLTACNPLSEKLTEQENELRQEALAKELRCRSLKFIDGIGHHPAKAGQGEPSFLILGLTLVAAKNLGQRLAQNALVWSGQGGRPQLISLR